MQQLDWLDPDTRAQLKEYFGLSHGAVSSYLRGEPFHPLTVGDWKGVQMHETARQGGVYTFTDGGKPAHKLAFLNHLDAEIEGRPASAFQPAFRSIKERDPELWQTAWIAMNKLYYGSLLDVAQDLSISENGVWKRLDRFVRMVCEWMHIEERRVKVYVTEAEALGEEVGA